MDIFIIAWTFYFISNTNNLGDLYLVFCSSVSCLTDSKQKRRFSQQISNSEDNVQLNRNECQWQLRKTPCHLWMISDNRKTNCNNQLHPLALHFLPSQGQQQKFTVSLTFLLHYMTPKSGVPLSGNERDAAQILRYITAKYLIHVLRTESKIWHWSQWLQSNKYGRAWKSN